jgi:CrcB protein
MTASAFLQVAAGGALGSVLRFGLGLALARPGFPVAVMAANVAGCFAMGIAVVLVARHAPGAQPFVMAGLLGGFTTFSAFSLEALTLWERGQPGQAAAYVALSVGLSLAAVALGAWLARGLA